MPFIVYVISLDAAVEYWDTGEAQVVPWIFGIMHATGFPAFTILAGIFAHVTPFGTVAWRISLFSALAMSLAAWLIARIIINLDGNAWIAAASAWVFAFGSVAWTRGTRAEVHALALFFAIATLYAGICWYRNADARMLVIGALAFGLGIATHPIVALLLPALLVMLLAQCRKLRLASAAFACVALLFGIAWYAYLPARSAAVTAAHLDPTRRLGLPPGRAFWDNNHPASWTGFLKEVRGDEFSAGGTLASVFTPASYAGRIPAWFESLFDEFTPIGLCFALGGLYVLLRRDVRLGIAVVFAFAAPTAFALAYTIEADPHRYYLIGFAVAAVLMGHGACALAQSVPEFRRATIAVLAALSATLLLVNRDTFAQPDSRGAQAVIETVLKNTPRNAVLLSPWIDATPLAYAAYVEHALGDRIVDSAWLADDAKLVPAWTLSRPVFVVGTVSGNVPGFRTIPIPGSPVLYRVVRSRAQPHSSSRSSSRIFVRRPTTTTSCWRTHFCTRTRGSLGRGRTSMR